jgi:hypothetical protein
VTPPERTGESSEGSGSSHPPRGLGRRLVEEADALDLVICDAAASTLTPTLDVPLTWISNAAT